MKNKNSKPKRASVLEIKTKQNAAPVVIKKRAFTKLPDGAIKRKRTKVAYQDILDEKKNYINRIDGVYDPTKIQHKYVKSKTIRHKTFREKPKNLVIDNDNNSKINNDDDDIEKRKRLKSKTINPNKNKMFDNDDEKNDKNNNDNNKNNNNNDSDNNINKSKLKLNLKDSDISDSVSDFNYKNNENDNKNNKNKNFNNNENNLNDKDKNNENDDEEGDYRVKFGDENSLLNSSLYKNKKRFDYIITQKTTLGELEELKKKLMLILQQD